MRATFWDRFNETIPHGKPLTGNTGDTRLGIPVLSYQEAIVKAVDLALVSLKKPEYPTERTPMSKTLWDGTIATAVIWFSVHAEEHLKVRTLESLKVDIATELGRRQYYYDPSKAFEPPLELKPPIFILQEDKLRKLGFLQDKRSYIQQVGKFFGKVWDVISLQPVDKFRMTPFTVTAHSHYWIITQHPEWFSLAGINISMPTPENWENWKKLIYKHFTDREIRLSNEEKIIFMAELLWTGETKKYTQVMAEAKVLEDGLYEEYKASYTKSEVQSALFLAFMKYWILCKRIRVIAPGKGWEFKQAPFGYRDRYAVYTAGRVGYQQRIEEAMRLAMIHRGLEILFSAGVDWAIWKHLAETFKGACMVKCLAKSFDILGCIKECFGIEVEVEEEEEKDKLPPPPPPPPPEEAKIPWPLIAAGVGLLLLATGGE